MALSGRVDKSTGVGSPGSNASLNNVVTTIQSSIPGPAGMPTDYFVLEEREANGVDSTLIEGGGVNWYQRPLNTIAAQSTLGIVSTPDVNGTFTLPSGSYRFHGRGYIRNSGGATATYSRMAVRVGDEGDADVQKFFGDTIIVNDSAGEADAGFPEIFGRFTIDSTKNISLHQWIDALNGISFGNNAGTPASGGGDSLTVAAGQAYEVYAWLIIEREGGDITEETQVTVTDPLNPLAAPKAKPLPPELLINPTTRRIQTDRSVNEEFRATEEDWVGINTRNTPESLGPKEARSAINADSIGHPQELRQRRGIVKMSIDSIVDVVGVSIYDLRLIRLSTTAANNNKAYMGITWEDALLVQQFTEINPDIIAPPAIELDFEPAATVTAIAGPFLNVAIAAITRLSGIEAVRVAWDEDAWPNDVFGSAQKKSANFEEFFWFGDTAFNEDTTVALTAATTYYVTVWIKSHLGWSLPKKTTVVTP